VVEPAMQDSHSTWDWAMMDDLQYCFFCCSGGLFFFFLGHQGLESLLFDDLVCNEIPLLKM
jgi:hypothetical protein